MKLHKTHREALISKLKELNEELDIQKRTLESFVAKKDEDMAKFTEIGIFLIEKQIELIEQSLIDNEIDF